MLFTVIFLMQVRISYNLALFFFFLSLSTKLRILSAVSSHDSEILFQVLVSLLMFLLVKKPFQSWKSGVLSIIILFWLLFVETKLVDKAEVNCLFILPDYLNFSLLFSEFNLQGLSMSWCMHLRYLDSIIQSWIFQQHYSLRTPMYKWYNIVLLSDYFRTLLGYHEKFCCTGIKEPLPKKIKKRKSWKNSIIQRDATNETQFRFCIKLKQLF